MKRKKFTPVSGKVYENQGGGAFRCLWVISSGKAVMQNVVSGWTFNAHGCGIYENGNIDWDYSTSGYFAEVKQ